MKQTLTLLLITISFWGCHNYYMATNANSNSNHAKASVTDSLNNKNRYFILRNGSQSYYMKTVKLSEDRNTLNCKLETLAPDHQLHLVNGRGGKLKYQKNSAAEFPGDMAVLNEVHFYMQPDNSVAIGNYNLQLDKIQKIEILERDKIRTRKSYTIGAIGYTLGAVALVAIILAAIKSSCPFVSAYDGGNFSLQGEIYGGAIFPQLERHDYLPLKMQPLADGSLQLKISNELQERQFTDLAELWVVTHDKNSSIHVDEKGNLYEIKAPQSPVLASLNGNKDVTAALTVAGDNTLLYMDDTSRKNAGNDVQLQFNKPAAAKKAKLLLTLKNSYFLDLLYGELAKGFGKHYATYMEQQKSKTAAELLLWVKEQQIPLEVSVKTQNGWEKITALTTVGPVATRSMVIPIELPQTTEAFTTIKLSSGFMFWEIDYAAIDYTADGTFTIQKATASTATDQLGKNVLPSLIKEDGIYLAQPQIGDIATIKYRADLSSDPSKKQTYILHTKGYYEHVRDFKNEPDFGFLNQFKQPDAFPKFGMTFYKKLKAENLKTLAKAN